VATLLIAYISNINHINALLEVKHYWCNSLAIKANKILDHGEIMYYYTGPSASNSHTVELMLTYYCSASIICLCLFLFSADIV